MPKHTRKHKRKSRYTGGAIDDALNADGRTALLIAARDNNLAKVKELLAAGADVNKSKTNDGITPLYAASQNGHTEVVKTLLSNSRTDVNKENTKYGTTPLYIASQYGHAEIVKLLLSDSRIDVNKATHDGCTALFVASQDGHAKIVKLLLSDSRTDVNKAMQDSSTPLYVACQNGRTEIVKLLVSDSRTDVNKAMQDGTTPLIIACAKGRTEVVKLLVSDSRTDINKENMKYDTTPLFIASKYGHAEIVKLLLSDSRIDVNKAMHDGSTALFVASQNGHANIVKLLVSDSRIEINKSNENGSTPLYVACQNGHTEVVKLLVSRTDINKENTKYGTTPLFIAGQYGHAEIVKLLLSDSRIDVNKAMHDDTTPLFIASQLGHKEIVELLLSDPRTDINKARQNGSTPLYVACLMKHILVVKLLLTKKDVDKTYALQHIHNLTKEIQNLLKDPSPLWPGFSKSDSEKLGLLFEERIHPNTLTKRPKNAEGKNREEILYSHCPICLKYVSHDEATCMYMSHNCSELKGFHHKALFNKYKHRYVNAAGVETGREVVAWCTLCGRICKGHQHYKLDSYTVDKPTLLPPGAPYDTDCRKTNGGGGKPEKVQRHQRLREYAQELNNRVGEITTNEALELLVEEMWNAPLQRKERLIKEIEAQKKFTNIADEEFANIPNTRFPNAPNSTSYQKGKLLSNTQFQLGDQTFIVKNDELYENNARNVKADALYQHYFKEFKKVAPLPTNGVNIPYPNAGSAELFPIVYHEAPEGFVDPTGSDDTENIIQFRHRMANGSINNHENPATDMIGKDILLLKIASAINNGEMDMIGPCWLQGCTALIYPQELKAAIEASEYSGGAAGSAQKAEDLKTYERYRYEFNQRYRK